MEIKKFNDMKAYLLKPNRLFSSKQDRIGGGVIEGEDLGTRTGFNRPRIDAPGLEDEVKKLFNEGLSTNQVLENLKQKPEFEKVSEGVVKRIKKEFNLGVKQADVLKSQSDKYNKLKELVEQSNNQLKFVEMQTLRERVGLPKKTAPTDQANIEKFNVPKLDSAADKVRKGFFKIINNPNIPVEEVFDISSKIGRDTNLANASVSKFLQDIPEYQDFKPTALKLQSPAFKAGVMNKGKTLADVMEMAEAISPSSGYTSVANTPERFILNSVTRHIAQGGDKVEWVVPPSDTVNDVDAVFKYKGNNYNYYDLLQDGRKIDDFKEIYKSYEEMNDLLSREVTDPVTKGKTTFKDLMTRAYAQGADFAKTTNPIEIDHFGSVKNEPFSNLRVIPARINRAAGAITNAAQRATTGVFTKKGQEWTPAKSKLYLQKSGYNFTKDINKLFNDEVKLANDILVKGRKLRKVSDIGKEAVKKKFTELLNIEGVQRASEIDRPEAAIKSDMFTAFNERIANTKNIPLNEVEQDVSNVSKVLNEMSSKMSSGVDPNDIIKYVGAEAKDLVEFGKKYGGATLGKIGKTAIGLDLPIMQVAFASMQDWEEDSPLWVTLPAAFTDEVANAFNLYNKTGGKTKEFGKFLASSFVPRAARSPLFKAVSKFGKGASLAAPILELGQEAYKFEKQKRMLPEIARQFDIPIEEARKGFQNYIRSTIPQDPAAQGMDELSVPESPGLPRLKRTFQDIGSLFGFGESPYKDPNAKEESAILPKAKPSLTERGFVAEGGRMGFKNGTEVPVVTVDDKIDELISFYQDYLKQGGKMNFMTFAKKYIPQNFATGGRVGFSVGGIASLFRKAAEVSDSLRNVKNSVFDMWNNVRMFGEQEGVAKNLMGFTNIPDKNRKTSSLQELQTLKTRVPEKYHQDLNIMIKSIEQNNFETAWKEYEKFEKELDPTLKFENIPQEYFPMLDPLNDSFVIKGPRDDFKVSRYRIRTSMDLNPKTGEPTGKYQTEKYDTFDPETRTFRKEPVLVGADTEKGKKGFN
jgi:hypothetical protein